RGVGRHGEAGRRVVGEVVADGDGAVPETRRRADRRRAGRIVTRAAGATATAGCRDRHGPGASTATTGGVSATAATTTALGRGHVTGAADAADAGRRTDGSAGAVVEAEVATVAG